MKKLLFMALIALASCEKEPLDIDPVIDTTSVVTIEVSTEAEVGQDLNGDGDLIDSVQREVTSITTTSDGATVGTSQSTGGWTIISNETPDNRLFLEKYSGHFEIENDNGQHVPGVQLGDSLFNWLNNRDPNGLNSALPEEKCWYIQNETNLANKFIELVQHTKDTLRVITGLDSPQFENNQYRQEILLVADGDKIKIFDSTEYDVYSYRTFKRFEPTLCDPIDTAALTEWSEWTPASGDGSTSTVTQTRTRVCSVTVNGDVDAIPPTCEGWLEETKTSTDPNYVYVPFSERYTGKYVMYYDGQGGAVNPQSRRTLYINPQTIGQIEDGFTARNNEGTRVLLNCTIQGLTTEQEFVSETDTEFVYKQFYGDVDRDQGYAEVTVTKTDDGFLFNHIGKGTVTVQRADDYQAIDIRDCDCDDSKEVRLDLLYDTVQVGNFADGSVVTIPQAGARYGFHPSVSASLGSGGNSSFYQNGSKLNANVAYLNHNDVLSSESNTAEGCEVMGSWIIKVEGVIEVPFTKKYAGMYTLYFDQQGGTVNPKNQVAIELLEGEVIPVQKGTSAWRYNADGTDIIYDTLDCTIKKYLGTNTTIEETGDKLVYRQYTNASKYLQVTLTKTEDGLQAYSENIGDWPNHSPNGSTLFYTNFETPRACTCDDAKEILLSIFDGANPANYVGGYSGGETITLKANVTYNFQHFVSATSGSRGGSHNVYINGRRINNPSALTSADHGKILSVSSSLLSECGYEESWTININ